MPYPERLIVLLTMHCCGAEQKLHHLFLPHEIFIRKGRLLPGSARVQFCYHFLYSFGIVRRGAFGVVLYCVTCSQFWLACRHVHSSGWPDVRLKLSVCSATLPCQKVHHATGDQVCLLLYSMHPSLQLIKALCRCATP